MTRWQGNLQRWYGRGTLIPQFQIDWDFSTEVPKHLEEGFAGRRYGDKTYYHYDAATFFGIGRKEWLKIIQQAEGQFRSALKEC